uniref:hypothetical protein n=1 Tax=Methylomonas sp. SPW-1 TaxID=3438877 RepID=UPI00402BD28B
MIMTEDLITNDNLDEPEKQEKKKPIPRDVSGVGYITKEGFIRYCRTGIDIPLPDDFKEWDNPKFN